MFNLLSIFLFLAAFASLGVCSEPTPLQEIMDPKELFELGWTSGIAGVILIGLGSMLCFSGKRFFKIFLAVSGFLAFGILTLNLLSFVDLVIWTFTAHRQTIFMVGGAIGGALGAALCFFMWEIGVLASAGFGGYSLGVWIMSMKAGGVIEQAMTRGVFITICVVAAVCVAWFLDQIAIVLTSAISGALSIIVGVDCFLRWGLTGVLLNIVLPGDFAKLKGLDVYIYVEIAFVAVFAVCGAVLQFLSGSSKQGYGKSDGA